MSDWLIVRDGGMWLLGKRDFGPNGVGRKLSPVFELTLQVSPTPEGVTLAYGAQPLVLLASLDTWELSSPDVNTWPVTGCSAEKHIREAIRRAQEMVQSMRAQQAGLVIARDMPGRPR